MLSQTHQSARHRDHSAAVVSPPGVEAGPLAPGGRAGVEDVDLVQVVHEAVPPPLTPGVSPAPDDEDEAGDGDSTVVSSQGAGRVSGRAETPGESPPSPSPSPAGQYLQLRPPLTPRLSLPSEHEHFLPLDGGGGVARVEEESRGDLPAQLWSGGLAGVAVAVGGEAVCPPTHHHQSTYSSCYRGAERSW